MMEKKEKVLMFVDRMRVGGIQILLRDIYRNMSDANIAIEFLVLDDGEQYDLEEELIKEGAIIHKLKGIWIRNIRGYQAYRKAMNHFFAENHDYSVVHMHSSSKNFFLLYYARKYNIPIRIAHSHNTNFQSKSKAQIMLGNVFKFPLKIFATHYFACSEYAGQWLFGHKCVKNGEVFILKNGVDLKAYEYKQEVRDKMRKELGFNEAHLVIGHVGRFTPQKNHTFLIDVFAKIHQQNANTILVMAGIGDLQKECMEKVRVLGLENNVRFLGFRTDVNYLLHAMDVFLMPSLYEGFPVTGIEAQACGLPCVFSDTITREAHILEQVKYISLSSSPDTWARETLSLVSNFNRALCKDQLKEKGFDIEDYVDSLKDFYKAALL
ncbi:MAG: glycosyltransferase family 1 protein [Anaerocolumna sp.]